MITAIELPDGTNDPRLTAIVKAANGKTLLIFDPTDEETFGWAHSRRRCRAPTAIFANGADSQVLRLPVLSPESAILSRKGSFVLAADGTLTGDITDVFNGVDAARERAFQKDSDAKEVRDELEKGLDSDLPGLTFKGYEFHETDNLDQPVNLDLQISAANYAHPAGSLLLLRARVIGSNTKAVPEVTEGKPRAYAIEIGHPGDWRDSFDIALPPGYVIDETPDPVDVDMDFASYHAATTAKGNMLHYEREFVVRQVEIPPEKADDFRKLESAILSDEKSTAVLRKQ